MEEHIQTKTKWSDKRLRNLFGRYNQLYWQGRLYRYRVVQAELSQKRCYGYCDPRTKRIAIDPDQHSSDREIRATLLHEMAHAASREPGHGVGFFAQMERLIKLGAPVSVRSPEAGGAHIFADVVPARFPRLRAKMNRAENRREREVMAQTRGLPVTTITDDMIVTRFEDAMLFTWKNALLAVGLENGLVDDTGRPLTAWARRLVAKGRQAHRRARRDHLESEKHWRQILGSPCTSEPTAVTL
jgi:hypothetical protein